MNTVNNISFGRRKTPRYIYHFTNKKSYQSILNDGFIKASPNDDYLKGKGIFAVALQDFFKRWGLNKIWDDKYCKETLRTSLLRKVAYWMSPVDSENELVILKIPTDKLDKSKLKIRSQNRFFKALNENQVLSAMLNDVREHLEGGTPAKESRRYNNRKEALEYVYQDDIPIDYAKQIGQTVDIYQLRQYLISKKKPNTRLSADDISFEALKQAFKDTPEEKCLFITQNK